MCPLSTCGTPSCGEYVHPDLQADISIFPAEKIRKMPQNHEGERPPLPPVNSRALSTLSLNSQPALHTSTSQTPAQLPRTTEGLCALQLWKHSATRVLGHRKFTPIASLYMNQMQSPYLKSRTTCFLPASHSVSCLASR